MHGMTKHSPVRGDDIKRLRVEAGLSQQRLATEAGVGMSTLNRAERSDEGVTYGTIVKLARVLGVDPSTIFDDAPNSSTYQAVAVAPAWAQQQAEQLQAQLDAMQRTLERMEHAMRDIRNGLR